MPWRHQFKSNEEYNAWYRRYRELNRKKIREYKRKYNSKWRRLHGYHNEEAWRKRNPEKRKAHQILQYAVKTKKIFRQPCELCGNPKAVAHHPNYKKPLNVLWVCHACHYDIHRDEKISTT